MDLSNENIIHVKKDNIEYLQFRKLLEYKDRINHAYSIGIDRNYRTVYSDEKKYRKAINDYKELCNELEENYINIVKPNQSHTKNVQVVNKKIKLEQPDVNL